LGARSCCLVLPRSSRTYVGLNCYVPWGSAEALRRAILYRGDTRGSATNHEVTPEIFIKGFRLLTRVPQGTPLPTSEGQTDGYQMFATGFQTVTTSGFTPRRLSRQVISPFHASRSRPGGSTEALVRQGKPHSSRAGQGRQPSVPESSHAISPPRGREPG